jgi:hypothetical protein
LDYAHKLNELSERDRKRNDAFAAEIKKSYILAGRTMPDDSFVAVQALDMSSHIRESDPSAIEELFAIARSHFSPTPILLDLMKAVPLRNGRIEMEASRKTLLICDDAQNNQMSVRERAAWKRWLAEMMEMVNGGSRTKYRVGDFRYDPIADKVVYNPM